MPDDEQGEAKGPNPMDEENFPRRNPTRTAVDREMREPSNVRGPTDPVPDAVPVKEAGAGRTDIENADRVAGLPKPKPLPRPGELPPGENEGVL